jgi:hypothetical protein
MKNFVSDAMFEKSKISSFGKDRTFVNSDLSCYDLEDLKYDDYRFALLAGEVAIEDKAFTGVNATRSR